MKKETSNKIKDNKKHLASPPCGLCGKKTKPSEKLDCCENWICNDENEYVMFSYARNSCARNHRRFTLCGFHKNEEHKGSWKNCKKCLESFKHELEMYVWYGTNEYNFEKLDNPPKFQPTHCAGCEKIIRLPEGGLTSLGGIYVCEECMQDGFDIRAAAGVDSKSTEGQGFDNTQSGQIIMKNEINEDGEQILKRRMEIDQELLDLLKETKSDFSLDDIKLAIYNEEETDDMQKVIAMLDDGNSENLSNVLEVVTDAWNYFPHKSLNGLSPNEKLLDFKNKDSN